MPRSRGSEMPKQRISPRAPLHLKPTACSEANSLHRSPSERSPKLDDRRFPHSPLHEKKKGSRVADLETKLGQAQEELKKLKEQLAEAEAAKRDAQMELEETKKLFPFTPASEDDEKEKTINIEEEKIDEQVSIEEKDDALVLPVEDESVNSPTTDVFEVARAKSEVDGGKLEEGTETKGMINEESNKEDVTTGEKVEEEVERKLLESAVEMGELRAIMAEQEKKLDSAAEENGILRKKAEEAKAESSVAREKVEEMREKLAGAEEELSEGRAEVERLREKVEAEEGAKASLEAEMKRLRIQTDQWRKAAEAAASVLATGDGAELNGRRVGESCRSMEKHLRGYDISEGCGGWSPVIAGEYGDDGIGGGKRRGGGIRMFGDLWKKKGPSK